MKVILCPLPGRRSILRLNRTPLTKLESPIAPVMVLVPPRKIDGATAVNALGRPKADAISGLEMSILPLRARQILP